MTTIKNIKYLLTIITIAFLQSCSSESVQVEFEEKANSMRIGYSIEGVDTRIEADVFETEIKEAVMIFYNSQDGSFVDYVLLNPINPQDRRFELEFPSYFKPGEKYKVLISANYRYYSNEQMESLLNAGYSYEEMREKMVVYLMDNEYIVSPLPYTGKLVDHNEVENLLTVPAHNPSEGKLDYRVIFKRIVSRIDLLNKVPGKLNIQWAKLVNYRDQSYMYSDLLTGQIVRNRETNPNSLGVAKPYNEKVEGQTITQQITGKLYCFTNSTHKSTVGDEHTTALLVCGYYNNSSTLSYYRINLATKAGRQDLKYNTAYLLTITDVNRVGAATEEEAINEDWSLIDYDFGNEWLNMGKYIVTDERGNYICVSSNVAELDNGNNSKTNIQVAVNSGAKWDVKFKESDSHMSQYFEIIKYRNSFDVKIKSVNENKVREAVLEVTNSENSKLIKTIQLSQLSLDKYLLKIDDHTEDFTFEVDYKNMKFIEFTVYTGEDCPLEWYSKLGDQSSNQYVLLKSWGYHKDKLVLENTKRNEINKKIFVEVYRADGKQITITLNINT